MIAGVIRLLRPTAAHAPATTVEFSQRLGTAVIGAGLLLLALAGGGYGLELQAALTIVLCWTLVVGLVAGIWPRSPIPGIAVWAGLSLAGLGVLALVSSAWSGDAGRSFSEAVLAALYAALFAVVAASSGRGAGQAWVGGLVVGGLAVAAVALASRFAPAFFPEDDLIRFVPDSRARLSYPIGYWNGLGALLAATLTALAASASFATTPLRRALLTAPLPALVGALYLTASTGAAVAVACGLVVLLVISPARRHTAAVLLAAGLPSAGLIGLLSAQDAVVEGLGQGGSGRQGVVALVATVFAAGAAAAGRTLLEPLFERVPVHARSTIALLLACGLLVGLVLADPPARVREFTDPSSLTGTAEQRGDQARDIANAAGNGRYQFWRAAMSAIGNAPVLGLGAGGYEAWWAREGSVALPVRNAHSLYLEVLAELGVAGGLLLGAFLLAPVLAYWRRFRRARAGPVAATAFAVLACGLLSAGIEWTWELPAVFFPVVVAAALLTGPASAGSARRVASSELRLGAGVLALLLAWGGIVIGTIALAGQSRLGSSRDAARAGNLAEAAAAARDARSFQPWAASPRLQLALVEERAGRLGSAGAEIRAAIERAPDDWRLWLVRARVSTAAGDIPDARAALRQARFLNPRMGILGPGGARTASPVR